MISWIVSIFGISKVCRLDAKKLTWGAFKTSLLLKSADEMNPTRAISVTNDWYSLLSKRLDILTLGSSSLVSFALIWACIRGAVCVQLCIKFSTDCATSPQHPFLPPSSPPFSCRLGELNTPAQTTISSVSLRLCFRVVCCVLFASASNVRPHLLVSGGCLLRLPFCFPSAISNIFPPCLLAHPPTFRRRVPPRSCRTWMTSAQTFSSTKSSSGQRHTKWQSTTSQSARFLNATSSTLSAKSHAIRQLLSTRQSRCCGSLFSCLSPFSPLIFVV